MPIKSVEYNKKNDQWTLVVDGQDEELSSTGKTFLLAKGSKALDADECEEIKGYDNNNLRINVNIMRKNPKHKDDK